MIAEITASIAKAIGLVILAFLTPVLPIMLATLGLIVIDFICGIMRARKQGEKIQSKGFRRLITKIVSYNLFIITGLIIQVHLVPFLPIISVCALAIAIAEGTSIVENLTIITGKNLKDLFIEKLMGSKEFEKYKSTNDKK